jgi:hypothetical protein
VVGGGSGLVCFYGGVVFALLRVVSGHILLRGGSVYSFWMGMFLGFGVGFW